MHCLHIFGDTSGLKIKAASFGLVIKIMTVRENQSILQKARAASVRNLFETTKPAANTNRHESPYGSIIAR
tara:strand:+ start:328 stop:540 length:213 start_codon:yes stop_codon:yes gene_type:complete